MTEKQEGELKKRILDMRFSQYQTLTVSCLDEVLAEAKQDFPFYWFVDDEPERVYLWSEMTPEQQAKAHTNKGDYDHTKTPLWFKKWFGE